MTPIMKKLLLVLVLLSNVSILLAQRNYSYIQAIDKVHYSSSGSALNPVLCPIWEDSTILRFYPTLIYDKVNFTSVATAINPRASLFNDQAYLGEMKITPTDTFYIDSIYLKGAYFTPNSSGAVNGDRLEISVVLESDTNLYTWSGNWPTSSYLTNALPPTTNTSVRAVVPYADSVNRIAGYPTRVRYTWTHNFTNNDTSAPASNSSYNIRNFGFAPPNPIQVLPGNIAIVSFTFFSGDTWSNSDSVSFYPGLGSKNHFRAQFHEETPFNELSYRCHTENGGGDFCNSSLMFSRQPNHYDATVLIEAFNTPGFSFEHLDVGWGLSCPSCGLVSSVDQIKKPFEGLKVYPNPTTNYTMVDFSEPLKSDVQCIIYSITGEKLIHTSFAKNQTMDEVNLNDLPVGIYICELRGNDKLQTIRLVKH